MFVMPLLRRILIHESGVTSHCEIDQSISDMKKIAWGEAKQNPSGFYRGPNVYSFIRYQPTEGNILINITLNLVDTKPDIEFDFHRFI